MQYFPKMKPILIPLLPLVLAAGCVAPGAHEQTIAESRAEAAKAGGSPLAFGAVTPAAPELQQSQPSATSLVRLEGPLSLADALTIGLTNNLSLFQARLARAQADGAYDEALGAALPALQLTAQHTSDLVERDSSVQPDRTGFGLMLKQPIYRSGAIGRGIEFAKYYRESVDLAIRDAEQAVLYAIASGYLNVLYEQKMVEVYEESVGTAERLKSTTESRHRAGVASQYEMLRADVEVTSANANLIRERNTLRTARITLLKLLGVDQNSDITLSDDLAYVAEAFDSEAMIARAFEFRPDLAQAEANVRMARLQYGIVQSQYGVTIDGFVKGGYETPNPNDMTDDGWDFDASVGATAAFTLYDGTARRGKYAQARAKIAEAEAALRSAEEDARVAVITAVLDVTGTEELYLSQQKVIETATEAKRMIESGYKQGRNTQVEVLDAQSALTSAMGNYYSAIRAHSLAGLTVRRNVGDLKASDITPYVTKKP